MFTGIIETMGRIRQLQKEEGLLHLTMESELTSELKIDQSLAHNGICLTVVALTESTYRVTAIPETIEKTTIGFWQEGQQINLERCLKADGRLDGHMVQGHVDDRLQCSKVVALDQSWDFWFTYESNYAPLLIPQGSICINGISLTVSDLTSDRFKVSIIPYTFEHTSIGFVKKGDWVNVEFDVLGKYILRNKMLAQ